RTDYGIDSKKLRKLDIQLKTNQDFIIAPLFISLALVFSSFLFSYVFAILLKVVAILLKDVYPPAVDNVKGMFYLFFLGTLSFAIFIYFRKSVLNAKLLHNSWILLKKLFNLSVSFAALTVILSLLGVLIFDVKWGGDIFVGDLIIAIVILLLAIVIFIKFFYDFYLEFNKISFKE
ncbi:MAG: hypothetical protein AABY11_00695, partial [archaeon]